MFRELVIHQAGLRDLPSLVMLEKACFPGDAWSEESLRRDLEFNENALYFIAKADGKPAGYASCWLIAGEGDINRVCVLPAFRGMRIGTHLVRALILQTEHEGAHSHTLEVRESNESAIRLYERCGFAKTGVRPGYYQDNGENAVIMWRIGSPDQVDPEMES